MSSRTTTFPARRGRARPPRTRLDRRHPDRRPSSRGPRLARDVDAEHPDPHPVPSGPGSRRQRTRRGPAPPGSLPPVGVGDDSGAPRRPVRRRDTASDRTRGERSEGGLHRLRAELGAAGRNAEGRDRPERAGPVEGIMRTGSAKYRGRPKQPGSRRQVARLVGLDEKTARKTERNVAPGRAVPPMQKWPQARVLAYSVRLPLGLSDAPRRE